MVVPARGGSKGVKRKNLRVVGGKPLLAYALNAAKAALGVSRLVVSTDDDEIAQVARNQGAEVPWMRPHELATDRISLIPVAQHALHAMRELGFNPDAVMTLQPTAPAISRETIEKAIALMAETNCDSVSSVRKIEQNHPYRAQHLREFGVLEPLFPEAEKYLQRQDRPALYGPTGGIYLRRAHVLDAWTGSDFCMGNDRRAVVVDDWQATNIDTELDLQVFEAQLQRHGTL